MVEPTFPVSVDSFEGSSRDTIDIGEELRALRDRVDVAEAESASLLATIRTIEAVETVLCNRLRDERQTRIEIER
uniref:Uncharacterized protein n=1 Tax=Tanacetum cinerariifolium TaxID=118510 RepID=A0A699QF74_TANCI|nr:hypothetical protein [Tanacetum cinerariifolium]